MGAINREWHLANRMPDGPTREDRAKWHVAHTEACGCRTPSPAEQELIDEYRTAHSEGGAYPESGAHPEGAAGAEA